MSAGAGINTSQNRNGTFRGENYITAVGSGENLPKLICAVSLAVKTGITSAKTCPVALT